MNKVTHIKKLSNTTTQLHNYTDNSLFFKNNYIGNLIDFLWFLKL